MRNIELKGIKNIAEYERVREGMRAEVIALKRHRRVELGPSLSLVFENRQTVLFQIQEMVRAERLVDDRRIQEEIDAYSNLLPRTGELSATLFIEIPGIAEMSHADAITAVNFFQGFDAGGIVLECGAGRSVASFESGFSNEEKMAAVQCLKFPVDASLAAALRGSDVAASITAQSGRYLGRTILSEGVRNEIVKDLAF